MPVERRRRNAPALGDIGDRDGRIAEQRLRSLQVIYRQLRGAARTLTRARAALRPALVRSRMTVLSSDRAEDVEDQPAAGRRGVYRFSERALLHAGTGLASFSAPATALAAAAIYGALLTQARPAWFVARANS